MIVAQTGYFLCSILLMVSALISILTKAPSDQTLPPALEYTILQG
jgi:hypothetical protein